MQFLRKLWGDQSGQDIIEYTLLLTFIALATAAVIGGGQNAIRSLWNSTNSSVTQASQAANSS